MLKRFVNSIGNSPRKIAVAAVCGVLALCLAILGAAGFFGAGGNEAAGSVSAGVSYEGAASGPKIIPLMSDSAGVDVNSGFRLLLEKPAEEDTVRSLLAVFPAQEYELEKVSQNEYGISFTSALKANSIYKFTYGGGDADPVGSWAFQTKRALAVSRTLPRNEAVQVPVDTGIEITFSHESVEDLAGFFEISPKTGGRFEVHKRTVVFVPDKLENDTIYTVRIKKGLGLKGSSDKLESDYVFSFQTALLKKAESGPYFHFTDDVSNFTPQAVPVLRVAVDDDMVGREIPLEVFRYRSSDIFLEDLQKNDARPPWALTGGNAEPYSTSGLDKVSDMKAQIARHEYGYWVLDYLLFPEPLAEGCYLVKANVDGEALYTLLQVNNSSVYILVGSNRTLAWVNDSSGGLPIKDAVLSANGHGAFKTGEDGIAILEEALPKPEDSTYFYFRVRVEGRPDFIARVDCSSYIGGYSPYSYYNSGGSADNYWTYTYLDKGAYLPDDTVNVWGLIKPRDNGEKPGNATLELVRYDYSAQGGGAEAVIDSKDMKLTPQGTFIDKLQLSNYNPGYYDILVKLDGQVITRSYMQIMEYTKPSYKIELSPDKSFLYAWDRLNIGVQASFYEGSPVPGLKLDYTYNMSGGQPGGKSGSLVCSTDGSASVTLTPLSDTNSWQPQWLDFYINNTDAEEQEVRSLCSATVFPRDTMFEVKSSFNEGKGFITFNTSRIDLSRLSEAEHSYSTPDDYRGAPVDTSLKVRLYERHYESKAVGEYYDYINKKKETRYEYYEVQNLVGNYDFKTLEGRYELEFPADKKKSYYVEVEGSDSANRKIIETEYLYNWNYYTPYSQKGYNLEEERPGRNYRLNEKVRLKVVNNGEDITAGKNFRFLYIRLKNGVLDYTVTPDPFFTFGYGKELIPNMYVKAVLFDGANPVNAGFSTLRYDQSEKKLNISVRPDKASYKPGDTASLSLAVTDEAGRPCSAELNLSVIDEAYFDIREQYVDILSGLYSPAVSSGLMADYLSYRPLDTAEAPMAEGGEGGDTPIRKDFRDSALFRTVTSGADGRAEISFRLPDNLTSWRVTYQAVTEDLKAGNGKINISSKLPFFTDTVFNKVFLDGDSPSVLVRAFGTELSQDDPVKYSITVSDPDGAVKTHEAQSSGSAPAAVPLGQLGEGEYTLTVRADSKGRSDALQRSFRVADSLLEAARIRYYDLTEGLAPEGGGSLTTLSFYNRDSSELYRELYSLYWSWGERIDQKLSRKIAGELLERYYGEKYIQDEEFDLSKYQTEDGGLALLSYDSSSPELSAKLCSLVGDAVDRFALKSYFNNILNNKDAALSDISFSYWGLAALNEPVLLDIRSLLATPVLEIRDRLALGVALAEIGDYETARQVYDDILKQKGTVSDSLAWIETGSGRDCDTEATALCSLIALRLDTPEKMKLFNYSGANSTSELLVNLERLAYVKNYSPSVSADGSFSYELDGVKKDIRLSKAGQYRLILTPAKLAAIKFYNINGNITVAASSTAPVKDLLAKDGVSPVGLARSYAANGSAVSFKRSDLVKITLDPVFGDAAVDGYYEITDILPAGLRYVSGRYYGDTCWYVDEVSGQKVVFGYSYSKLKPVKSITYYARAVSPGIFTADYALIKHSTSDLSGHADRVEITVEK
jgi:hypothetical protein